MVVKKHVQLVELILFSKITGVSSNAQPCKETLNLSNLNKKQQFIFWLQVMTYQIFQLFVVLSIGLINNTFVELIIMIVTFWIWRNILKKCWHSDTLMWCSIVTFAAFYILTKITLPFSISLFASTTLAGCFTYLLYRAGIYCEQNENPELQFRYKCQRVGLGEDDTEFAIKALFFKTRRKELAQEYKTSDGTIRNKITRLNKILDG